MKIFPTSYYTVKVRFAETDQMGVAHHASYLVWLEAARVAWLAERSMNYRDMHESGINLAVSNVNVNYKKSTTFNDTLTIATTMQKAQSRMFDFAYTISKTENLKDTIVATATTRHICIDSQGKTIRLPEPWHVMLLASIK